MYRFVGITVIACLLATLPQSPNSQDVCPQPLDVVLLVDQSGSILTSSRGVTIWDDSVLDFGARLALALPVGPRSVRMAVVKFSTAARVSIGLDDYTDSRSLELAVIDLEYGGGETNIAEGLAVAAALLLSPNGTAGAGAGAGARKAAIVLVSDGRANVDRGRTQTEADGAKARGVEIVCIGVTNRTDAGELGRIASEPKDGHLLSLNDADAVNRTVAEILDTTNCLPDNPVVNTTTASTTPSHGPTSLTTAPTTTTFTSCVRSADVALVIDESSAAAVDTWSTFVRDYVLRLAGSLPLSPLMVRIGVILFGGGGGGGGADPRVAIDFGRYSSASALTQAIASSAQYYVRGGGGDRGVAGALSLTRSFLFDSARGARGAVKKAVFVMVGGPIDGVDAAGADSIGQETLLTKAAGVEIFCIGDAMELKAVASVPVSEHYFATDDYNGANVNLPSGLRDYCALDRRTTPTRTSPRPAITTARWSTTDEETQLDVPVNLTTVATTTTTTSVPSVPASTITSTTPTVGTSVQSTPPASTTTIASGTAVSLSTSAGPSIATSDYSTRSTVGQSTGTQTPSSTQISSTATSPFQGPSTPTTTSATTYSTIATTASLSSTTSEQKTSTSVSSSVTTTSTTTSTSTTPTTTLTTTTTASNTPTTTTATLTTPTTTTATLTTPTTTTTTLTTPTTSTTTPTMPITTITTSTSTTTTSTTTSTARPTSTSRSSSSSSSSSQLSRILSTTTIRESTGSTSTTTPTTTTVIPCPKEIDIVLILDETTSIVSPPGGYNNWYGYILGFAVGLVNAFQVNPYLVRFGVVKFSWFARVLIPLDRYADAASLSDAVRNLTIDGGQTNIASGIRVGRGLLFDPGQGARVGVKKMVFIVTDGGANVEYENTQPEANATKALGVEIYSIGVTTSVNVPEMMGIVSEPVSTHFYFVNNYNQLQEVLVKLRGTICFAIPLSPSSSPSTALQSNSSSSSSSSSAGT